MQIPQPGMRVAFFGGSFDPAHTGHLAVARAARDALRLDAVLFAPVGTQPLKPRGASASFDERLEMTRLAIEGERGFEVSLIDAPRAEDPGRPNYTIDTLITLRLALPQEAKLFCLMGADSYLNLREWRRAAEIPFAAEMIVASRPGEPMGEIASALPAGFTLELIAESEPEGVELCVYSLTDGVGHSASFYLLPGLHEDVSATAIRAAVSAAIDGEPLPGSVLPAKVAEYIQARGLYR